MTQVSFTADYDDFGQPRMQASICSTREGRNYREAAASAEPYLATQSVMTYAQRGRMKNTNVVDSDCHNRGALKLSTMALQLYLNCGRRFR